MINKDLCPSISAELREKIENIEKDIGLLIEQIHPFDWNYVEQNLQSSMKICQIEEKQIKNEYRSLRKQLKTLETKLLIGHAYFHPPIVPLVVKQKKKKKKIKSLSIEQQWRMGIGNVYRRLQNERDRCDLTKVSKPPEEHQFVVPLPPPPFEEVEQQSSAAVPLIESLIIPFETPPLTCPPSPPPLSLPPECDDRFQSLIDDTIVKPTRLVNRTLNNLTQMSFHVDPDHCSSPKGSKKKKKKIGLPPLPPPPVPPAFSSTAIFDSHAFFTQNNTKTKKQKKKIDISRQPLIMTLNNESNKKSSKRRKKISPYDFQDDDDDDDDDENDDNRTSFLSTNRGNKKLLSDDLITARFAKNSHYQSHQSSMASIKSKISSKEKTKKTTRNILGIGTSSPSTFPNDENLSPGQLSFNEEEFTSRSTTRISTTRRQRRKR